MPLFLLPVFKWLSSLTIRELATYFGIPIAICVIWMHGHHVGYASAEHTYLARIEASRKASLGVIEAEKAKRRSSEQQAQDELSKARLESDARVKSLEDMIAAQKAEADKTVPPVRGDFLEKLK